MTTPTWTALQSHAGAVQTSSFHQQISPFFLRHFPTIPLLFWFKGFSHVAHTHKRNNSDNVSSLVNKALQSTLSHCCVHVDVFRYSGNTLKESKKGKNKKEETKKGNRKEGEKTLDNCCTSRKKGNKRKKRVEIETEEE